MAAERVDLIRSINTLPSKLKRLTLANCFAFQLSEGCSGACGRKDFCGLSARPGVGRQFDKDSVVETLKVYGSAMTEFSMAYFASDPLDFSQYPELLRKISSLLVRPDRLYTSTALPVGQEGKLKQAIKEVVKNGQTIRLSVTPHNVLRVKQFLEDVYGQQWLKRKPSNIDMYKMNDVSRLNVGLARDKSILEQENLTARSLVYAVKGIGCQDGILISPSGAEAMVVVGVSGTSPEGLIRWPVQGNTQVLPKAQSLYYLSDESSLRNSDYEKLENLNEAIPDIELIDQMGKPADVPLAWVAQRDLLFLAHFLYQLADYNQIRFLPRLKVNSILENYRFRLARAKIGAEEANNQEFISMVALIERAVSDLWEQALEGRRLINPNIQREAYDKYVRKADEKFLLSFDNYVPVSTDLTKYKS